MESRTRGAVDERFSPNLPTAALCQVGRGVHRLSRNGQIVADRRFSVDVVWHVTRRAETSQQLQQTRALSDQLYTQDAVSCP